MSLKLVKSASLEENSISNGEEGVLEESFIFLDRQESEILIS